MESIKLERVLIDTGCSRIVVQKNVVPPEVFEKQRWSKELLWKMNVGSFVTKHEVLITFILPTFVPSKEIQWTRTIDEANLLQNYDMIISRDLQQALGLDILWSKGHLQRGEISILMQSVLTRERLDEITKD